MQAEAYDRKLESDQKKIDDAKEKEEKENKTTDYGWAYGQSILIRPTVEVHFENMPLKCVGFR